jgi:15-cis-phytoene synthase
VLTMSTHLYTHDEDTALHSTERSTSFHYSFSFLPKEERRAINTVYAFCRRIDDIVDLDPHTDHETIQRKRERLNWWRQEVERSYAAQIHGPGTKPQGTRHQAQGTRHQALLYPVIKRFRIPKQYFLTLIDGCERDLTQRRYRTFDDLKEYCYSVASIVGLISIEIFGYRNEQTKQYAINLGYALQLTNILRDVKADKDRGYIYLPQEDLERFKYTEEDLMNEVYDERFRALMEFQAQRARNYYHRARTMLVPGERITMAAAEIMDAIYFRLLEKIELHDYQVFDKRIKVNALHKIIMAVRIWLGSKLFVKRLR